jgi:predicted small integral membrane protein
VLLFSGVWLVYTADRWLDARELKPGHHGTFRHAFARTYRTPLLAAWLVTLMASVALACLVLSRNEWLRCSGLLAAALGYTAVVQGAHPWQLRFCTSGAKQVAVAGLFASGVALFTQPGGVFPPALRAPCLGFFCLALLNLGLIATWECEHDAAAAADALVWAGRGVPDALLAALIGAVFLSGSLAWLAPAANPNLWRPLSAAFVMLLGLRVFGSKLPADTQHSLADLALLAPPWLWLSSC